MNEMKPEDVMRALECHYKEWHIPTDGMRHCDDCPYNSVNNCSVELVKDALDLLCERDAERKELWEERCRIYESMREWEEECKKYRDELREKDAEIERLKEENEGLSAELEAEEKDFQTLTKMYKTARADAITEFAERLKEAVKYIPWCDYPPVNDCIDQIAKELKEKQ